MWRTGDVLNAESGSFDAATWGSSEQVDNNQATIQDLTNQEWNVIHVLVERVRTPKLKTSGGRSANKTKQAVILWEHKTG
jgi:hypothetical protein